MAVGTLKAITALGYRVTSPSEVLAADPPGVNPGVHPRVDPRIMGILFADVLGFASLGDGAVPPFVEHFLGAIDELARRSPGGPTVKNIWGDRLSFLFDRVRDAGVFALDLCDLAVRTDWQAKGLPGDLNIRVALHAAPLLAFVDPVTRTPTAAGREVARAARFDAVAPAGLAYASREFAALVPPDGIAEFWCEPVEQAASSEQSSPDQIYVLKRNRQSRTFAHQTE